MIDPRYEKQIKKKYSRALVTGGAGFIGSHLCGRLLDLGLIVYSLDDFSTGKEANTKIYQKNKKYKSLKCDLTDPKKTEAIFKKYKFDIVFHQAASKKTICLKDPKRDLDVNGKGTLGLLQLTKKYKVKKFIHASTGSVYGEPQYFPQDEKHPVHPTSFYGISKLAGENYVSLFNRLYNIDTTILRYFHVYGPRQEHSPYGGVVSIFIRNCLKNQTPTIFGTGKQERSFTYVDDVVDANILVAAKSSSRGKIYNCASGTKVTVKELLDKIMKICKNKKKYRVKYRDWTPGDIVVFNVDNSEIKKLGLDFNLDLESGLEEVYAQLKENLK